ncbi:MAG: carbon-nitrogen hydrolase family protein [Bacteroidia bacterium]|nr:carbon-nitrogen hydrolase family protein [Bacteroidia bacterium]
MSTTNLIKNPGFEASAKAPDAWTITGPIASMQPSVTIDNKMKFGEKYSLKMESTNPNGQGKVVQTVQIQGGQTYLFNARFRAMNINSIDKSVLIRIKWFKEKVQMGYNYIYHITDDKDGWLLASDKIKAVPGAETAEISLVFRWSTGTLWWDEISMETCEAVPPRNVVVGTMYFRPPGPTVEKNVSLMSEMLDKAGSAGCDIVCLPEGWPTCDTGLGMTKVEANTLGGSASVMMSEKAKKYGMYIVSGLYDWQGDTLKNVAVLYDRQGKIQGVYEKVQLPDSETEQGAVPGTKFPVFTTDFGKIGILICWDIAFPEISRILAVNGAEMLFCPIWGDVRGNTGAWKVTARSRAIDNGVYFVTNIFDGHSVIVNPAGDILQESGTQGTLLTQKIDLNFSPEWYWLGNAGLGVWDGIWRKDRRSESYGDINNYRSSEK